MLKTLLARLIKPRAISPQDQARAQLDRHWAKIERLGRRHGVTTYAVVHDTGLHLYVDDGRGQVNEDWLMWDEIDAEPGGAILHIFEYLVRDFPALR